MFQTGALAGRGVELPPGDEIVVGRAQDSDLVVPDPSVSGHHAAIRVVAPDRISVRDLGSRHGTYADGERIDGAWSLAEGSELRFGAVSAVLRGGTAPAAEGQSRSRLPLVLAACALVLALGAVAIAALRDPGDDGDDERAATPTETPTATRTATPTPAPTPLALDDAYDLGKSSTLLVSADGEPSGSGFVDELGGGVAWVVTNGHVVQGGSEFAVTPSGGEPRAARLFSASECDDLALLRLGATDGLKALSFGAPPSVGDDVFILGYPTTATDDLRLQPKPGTVVATDARYERPERDTDARYPDLIQVDGSVIPGNSGGPLVAAADGTVVGVISLAESESVGYAIGVERAEQVLRYLRQGTSVPGFTLDYPDNHIVAASSPTFRRAVETDGRWRIVSVNGDETPQTLRDLCSALPALGDDVSTPVTYKIRKPDGNTFELTVRY